MNRIIHIVHLIYEKKQDKIEAERLKAIKVVKQTEAKGNQYR